MTIETSKGNTIQVDWMWGPDGLYNNELRIEMQDDRALSDIARDFEGCEHFHRISENEGDMDWDGYTVLKAIVRPAYERNPGAVQITLVNPDRMGV